MEYTSAKTLLNIIEELLMDGFANTAQAMIEIHFNDSLWISLYKNCDDYKKLFTIYQNSSLQVK